MILSALLATACGSATEVPEEQAPLLATVEATSEATVDPTGAADFLLDFGNALVGMELSRTLRLRNFSEQPVEIALGEVPAPFTAGGDAMIPATGDLELRFSWNPREPGATEALVTLETDGQSWTVRLAGVASAEPVCVPGVPRQVYFGSAVPGGEAQGTLRLENRGDAPCPLAMVELEGAAFSVRGELPREIPAGRAIEVELVARPTELGTTEGLFSLRVGDDVRSIPLRANGVEHCLALSGRGDEFEAGRACSSDTKYLTLTNVCDGPVLLSDVEITEGPFFIISRPPLSLAYLPGQVAEIAVRYAPRLGDPDESTGLVTLHSDREPVIEWEVAGTVRPLDSVVDHYSQPERPRMDLLLVVDDSPAMEPFLPQLREWSRAVGTFFETRRIDTRAAVTTTSLSATEGCTGSGADGRFLPFDGSGPRFVSSDDGNFGAAIEAQLPTQFCSEAPNRGLDAAIRAVAELGGLTDDPAHDEPNDGNLGFRRNATHLKVIFVTARDDASSRDPATWTESMGLEPTRIHMFDADAIFASGTCGFDPSTLRYADATRAARGYMRAACSDPWLPWLSVGVGDFGYKTRFFLTGTPFDADGDGVISDAMGELVVEVDGVLDPSTADDGTEHWSYNKEVESVDFFPGFAPPEGSQVSIRYRVACL